MGTQILQPNANGSEQLPGVTVTGGGGNAVTALTDASDASYITPGTNGHKFFELTTWSISYPAGAVFSHYAVVIRAASGGGTKNAQASLYRDGEGVTLIGTIVIPVTASIANYTAAPFSPASAPTQGHLDSMVLMLGANGTGGMNIYDAYVNVVWANPPTGTTTGPSGAQSVLAPTVTWTHTPGADAQGGQTKYQVKVFTAAQYGIGGFDPATSPNTYDSGQQSGAGTSLPLPVYLANGTSYRAYVRTAQTTNGTDQWTAFNAGPNFNIAATVPVPTALTPTNGSTLTTSRPAIGATATSIAGMTIKRQWQFATDAGFTTGVVTINDPSFASSFAGAINFPALPTRLPQGTWYLRVKSVDNSGVSSAWSATNTVTVAHVPTTTSRTPGGNQTLQYAGTIQVNWVFSDIDTEDFQTKYRAQMWRLSDPGTVLDSTLLTDTDGYHVFTIPGVTWKDNEIRWKVLVHDQDNVASAYSPEMAFLLSDNPVVTITAPASGGVVTTSQPTITWGHTASLGRTQAQYKVDITNVTTSTLVSTSGWLSGTNTSWTPPSPVVDIGPNYSATVTIIDSVGLTGSDINPFTASYPSVTVPTASLDNSLYPSQAKIHLDWSGTTPDATFYSWRVYRRLVGQPTWTRLTEIGTSSIRTYDDYTCPSQAAVEYAVVQVATLFSAQVESAYSPLASQSTLLNYVLTCQVAPALNVVLWHVNDDTFEEEQEQATLNLLGRGRRFEYGTAYGAVGSLTVSLRNVDGGPTAREQRLALNALRESGNPIYLLNPFGDVYAVGLASVSIQRVSGVGLHEMASATIGYTEVGDT